MAGTGAEAASAEGNLSVRICQVKMFLFSSLTHHSRSLAARPASPACGWIIYFYPRLKDVTEAARRPSN